MKVKLALFSLLVVAIVGGILYTFTYRGRAAGETISLRFYEKRDPIDQKFGVTVTDITSDATVQELKNYFPGGNVYIKLINPTPATIDSAQFASLQTASFKWHLSFSTYEAMTPVVQAYFAKYNDEIIVELSEYSAFDVAKTNTLKALKPDKIKFHAGIAPFWPREEVRDLLAKAPPPIINALAMKFENRNDGLWAYVKLMFDTMYDASKSIHGESSTRIVYPPGSMLSLSQITMPDTSAQSQIKRFSLMVSAMVTHVQTEANKAPIKFVNGGVFDTMTDAEKMTMALVAKQLATMPEIVWPDAFRGNGDPWDNPFVTEYNFKPIMGQLSQKNGETMGLLLNVSEETPTVRLPDTDYTGYKTYSNQRGVTTLIDTQRQIAFQPFESIVIVPPSMTIPTGESTPTATPPPNSTPTTAPDASGYICIKGGPNPVYQNNVGDILVTANHARLEDGKYKSCTQIKNLASTTRALTKVWSSFCPTRGLEPYCNPDSYTRYCKESSTSFNSQQCKDNWGCADNTKVEDMTLYIAPGETREYCREIAPELACGLMQWDIIMDDFANYKDEAGNPYFPAGFFGYLYYFGSMQCNTLPTATPVPSDTPTPTPTLTHTPTPTFTVTPTPTVTPIPTNTPIPTVTPIPPTEVPPAPTNPPVPTDTPVPPTPTTVVIVQAPTATPVQALKVEDQSPGIVSWQLILAPVALVILALFL